MTTKDEIKKQASIYTDDADNYLEYSDDRGWTDKNDKEFVEKAFIEGANWADSNPNMTREIGKVFEFEGTTLQVIETENMTCERCYFNYRKKCDIPCLPSERTDKKNVIFIKISE